MLYDQKNSGQTPHATLMAVFGKDFSCFKAKKISYIFQLKFENQANLHYSINTFLKQNLAITLRGRDV